VLGSGVEPSLHTYDETNQQVRLDRIRPQGAIRDTYAAINSITPNTSRVTNAGRHTAGVAALKEIARSDVLRGAQAGLDANRERAQPRGRQRGPCRILRTSTALQTKIDAEGGNGMRKSMLRKAVTLGLRRRGRRNASAG
jgi:hypothetical protein